MRKLLVLISWCLLGVSCVTGRNASGTMDFPVNGVQIPVISDIQPEAVFHGNIDVYKHHFSGVFALKKEAEDKYRMVLMSEVGMSLLDIGFTSRDYQVNYSIEPLRKSALLRLLVHDFLLLSKAPDIWSFKKGKQSAESEQFILYRKEKSKDFYFFEKGTMVKIVSKAVMNRTDIQFAEMKAGMAHFIQIRHRPVKLEMALKRIE